MNKLESIVSALLPFNGITLTKAQWLVVLKGAGYPKSAHFWKALTDNCLFREGRVYTMCYLDKETFQKVWNEHCAYNRASVKKVYDKKKARKKATQRTFVTQLTYHVNPDGTVTFDNPNIYWDRD